MVVQENGKDAEQDDEQEDDQRDEAVARDALFVAQRAQAAHAAGGEIGDEARIAGPGRLNCRRRRLSSAGKSYLRTPSSLNWSGVAVSSSARSGLTSSNTGSWTGLGGGAEVRARGQWSRRAVTRWIGTAAWSCAGAACRAF